jgi:hypothetical protein
MAHRRSFLVAVSEEAISCQPEKITIAPAGGDQQETGEQEKRRLLRLTAQHF